MGKNLKGKELGVGISQRSDGKGMVWLLDQHEEANSTSEYSKRLCRAL